MGILPLGQDGKENGVEVTYTGRSIYHKTDDEGHYDEKIESDGAGGYNHYKTSDGWATHSHEHVKSDGETDYDRPADRDSDKHPWTTRDDD